ncbi:MAG: amino acid permease [Rhodothermales bacterium]|nr:amino acid permease [Rhodothermales bacterium]
MAILDASQRLKKELGLFDVFAVSTGAMFSSGFFLLPGLAAAKAGPAVMLAYLFAGVLILPAMYSMAELSTALPRAGGSYFFLDRSLGPMVGTVGGLGTFLALTLKTAFALIGIGAYAAFFVELPIKSVAVALTVVFMAINIVGAKETTTLQRILVVILLAVLAFFTVQGFIFVFVEQPVAETRSQLQPFLPFGVKGLFSTIGFVFVSYAGLTKVASIAEEVRNPDRNIPLGMMLSLGVTTFIYVAGVFIMVAVLDPDELRSDLTPVATAAEAFFHWLPGQIGLLLIVTAALAAFASTGNAGLLSASRYPLAMARDRQLPAIFGRIGRFKTPTPAILAAGGTMIVFILVLDAEGIAKLASAFQLMIFMLINMAVVVMRESRIPSYDPGYRSPLYPSMQIFGIITSLLLIVYMGWLAIMFTAAIVVICLAWYAHYVRDHVERHGAIYHWFRRLGQRQFDALDVEFRSIMKEKGLRGEDPYEEVVARSFVLDLKGSNSFETVVDRASNKLSTRLPKSAEEITRRFLEGTGMGLTPVTHGVALPHFRTELTDDSEMVLVRSEEPILVPADDPLTEEHEPEIGVRTLIFLVSPESDPGQHLRILAQIAGRVDEPHFMERWMQAPDAQALREILLRNERYMTVRLERGTPAFEMAGKAMKDLDLPTGCLVAIIRRDDEVIVPRGGSVLEAGDVLTVIGDPPDLDEMRSKLR